MCSCQWYSSFILFLLPPHPLCMCLSRLLPQPLTNPVSAWAAVTDDPHIPVTKYTGWLGMRENTCVPSPCHQHPPTPTTFPHGKQNIISEVQIWPSDGYDFEESPGHWGHSCAVDSKMGGDSTWEFGTLTWSLLVWWRTPGVPLQHTGQRGLPAGRG